MDRYSFLTNATPEFIENLYLQFKQNPDSVDPEFRKFFEGFDFATLNYNGKAASLSADEIKVYNLIDAYRRKGHLIANTNPIKKRKDRKARLELENFGLSESDLERRFSAGAEIGMSNATLREILQRLQTLYCGTLGFEIGYVRHPEEIAFFREKIEKRDKIIDYPVEKKEHILRMLNKAVVFEKFLGTKYIGEKRFSLEGGEATIPALDAVIRTAAALGVEEVVIGMAHRGRLNVLANIMGKTYEEIFNEFEGNVDPDLTMGDGDVKYHLGFSSQYPVATNRSIYLKLMPNPSHLEAVNPVVCGYTRAKADAIYQSAFHKILPVLIHGDAAIAGQGIVYEVIQMAKLNGYHVGGTLHFVINNQIGFTTNFDDARSSDYSTSIAATIEAPVIHVNGDDIEAVVFACEIATEYRQRFQKDFFIDMVCYRRWGHNESDDPKFTQPGMYKLIEKHKNPRDIYAAKLEAEGSVVAEMTKRLEKEFWTDLQQRLDMVKQTPLPYQPQPTEVAWEKLRRATSQDFTTSPDTSISEKDLNLLIDGLNRVPEGFVPLRKVAKYLEERNKLMRDEKKIDWAAAELLAYGSILLEGKDVRLSGEDVKRGTFTHRHSVLSDENTDAEYCRLCNLSANQGRFFVYNSHLSEYGVLGFEYGYSLASPDPLVLWEAQFGDFANGAQIVIDQFIAAGESKWQSQSGLVLLLPHGYEGQGPEHSSARLERFLQLCAELNMVVVNITEPANFFHALRRQLAWPFRKPLVVMSPKSLLRHPRCISPISQLTRGRFYEMLTDPPGTKTATKIVFCSGKIYYDLIEYKEKLIQSGTKAERAAANGVAIARLEQLYPIPKNDMLALLEAHPKAEVYWVQEEPQNMGAWSFILTRLGDFLPGKRRWNLIARKNSASPATGYKKIHQREQEEIIRKTFA
ncbi:MAG: 2-oxoglutarate dehydrogenase E1 component [Chitinophagales bacterium]|nr:2-oxoglutarate dehydrogenase E1 component [Chitinophagales bacterium]MDW8418894.1 2-oxoglutarate dehydrogenase E1 component [Chitinophagales bacterium]